MGNSVEVNYQRTPTRKASTQSNPSKTRLSATTPSISDSPFTPHHTLPVRLSVLRGSLSASECFYALSSLVQQFYSLFKLYGKVVVSDQLCLVNQLGELRVDFCIDGPDTALLDYDQVTHSFVSALSQVVTLVERLARPQELETRESTRFRRELVGRVQDCHGNEEITYRAVMQLLTAFLEENSVRCNLLDAFLRHWNETGQESRVPQEQTPFLASSRNPILPVRHSLSTNNLNYDYYAGEKLNEDTITRQSQMQGRNSLKMQSKYRHKMVKTEGENYYVAMSKRNEYPPSNFQLETSHTRFEKTAFNRISHQYTLNILNAQLPRHNKSTASLKSAEGQCKADHRETSLRDFADCKLLQSSGKSYARSMLQQLARSVSIRDEPSSRDQIS